MTGYEECSLGPGSGQPTQLGRHGGLVIGLAQCGLIYYGLRLMSQGSTERTVQLTAQHEENMAQHEEAMTALKELIRRTAPRS